MLVNSTLIPLLFRKYNGSDFHFNDTRLHNDIEEETDEIFPTKIICLLRLLILQLTVVKLSCWWKVLFIFSNVLMYWM